MTQTTAAITTEKVWTSKRGK